MRTAVRLSANLGSALSLVMLGWGVAGAADPGRGCRGGAGHPRRHRRPAARL